MKVLVSGGNGFLGHEICRQLIAEGHTPISLSRTHSDQIENDGILQIQCDLANSERMKELILDQALEGLDAIIHSASKIGMHGSFDDFYQINVKGTQNLLDLGKKLKIEAFIYTSTPSVVFERESIENGDESLGYARSPLTHYAHTKAMAEKVVLSTSVDVFRTGALRPHLIWGEGDPHLLPRILERLKAGRLIQIGDGRNKVDVIHVQNAAAAHVQMLEGLIKKTCPSGEAYFVSDREEVVLWDFIGEYVKSSSLELYPKYQNRKKLSLRFGYFVGGLIEFIFKLFPFLGEPPLTRFVVLQLGMSHYFNISKALKDFYRPVR